MAKAEASQVMSLPLPPAQYFNLFSDENVKKNRVPRQPPPFENYSMFGNTFNNDEMIRSLESQGFKRLIPNHFDRRKELKKLNHSLFANFLDLIDLLIHFPDSPRRTEKIEDLSLLFVHIHHLLNEFRPHQARETLRVMMELQKRSRIETTIRFKRHLQIVREMVKTAFTSLPDVQVDESKVEPDEKMDVDVEKDKVDDSNNDNDEDDGSIDPLDRLMCSIVDEM